MQGGSQLQFKQAQLSIGGEALLVVGLVIVVFAMAIAMWKSWKGERRMIATGGAPSTWYRDVGTMSQTTRLHSDRFTPVRNFAGDVEVHGMHFR